MNEGGNPDGTNCRPAKLLLGAVRRASNAAQCADRCRGRGSCRGHHRTFRRPC